METTAIAIIPAKHRPVLFAMLIVAMCGSGGILEAQTWDCGSIENRGAVKATLANGTLRISGKGTMGSSPWRDDNNILITDVVIEAGVTSIDYGAFNRLNRLKSVTIPTSVTSIGGSAFSGCRSLTSIMIPGSVTSIGEKAFAFCSGLRSVTIQNGVKSIGKDSFYRCTGLTTVSIPSSVTSIGEGAFNMAFESCPGLTSITIPGSVKSIGRGAFVGCIGLTSIIIPSNVTSIGEYVFSGCTGLASINVNKDNPIYISVDGVLFNKSKNTLIKYPIAKQGDAYVIPDSVTTITNGAFAECIGLTSVTIPNGVTEIRDLAFGGTGLSSVTIPNNVTKIGLSAFNKCVNLTSITIPRKVTLIGRWAFVDCPNLTSVTSLSPVPPVVEDGKAFYEEEFSTNATLYVPPSSIDAYKRMKGWRGFKNIQPKGD